MYHSQHILTSLDGQFVTSVVSSDAWRCPRDPNDPCDAITEENDTSSQALCSFDGTTPCSEAGVTSDIYVTDITTRATAYFGTFNRRPAPTIKVGRKQINVIAGDCAQTAALPLVAAQPQTGR